MGAYWTHETLLAEREGYSVSILRVEEWGIPPYYELVLVASEQTVAERGDLVTALLTALTRGYEDALADPAAALDALVAASPDTDRALESEGIPLSASTWLDEQGHYGTQTAERWNAYGAWMIERGLISADLVIAAAWTNALLPGLPPATPAATPAT
jgi:putative hydroxymethylpyrimidine transport system substrate-binding protein